MAPGAAAQLGLLLGFAGLRGFGLDQNITTSVGESVLFPKIPFKEISEWVFLGAQRTNAVGKDLMFYHPGPHVFKAYEGRIQPYNGTFLLLNVSRQDEGWYCQTQDLQHLSYHYIRVLDPVCNISIVATQSENGVFLHSYITGKAVSVVWYHNENNVPASQLMPGNLSLQIPRREAVGYIECRVMCGDRGWQHTAYNFTSDGRQPQSRERLVLLSPVIFVVLLVLFLLLIVRCKEKTISGAVVNNCAQC
ncbi:uncharacterized protein [Pleurodeles waltl]|uniref:uncharacterized protein isoform X1 n=1 Tax=Pleurodeles waltl TaxID=8319 RepID=UPI0037095AA6